MQALRIQMLVANSVRRDPRVVREACALVDAGHLVRVSGLEESADAGAEVPFEVKLYRNPNAAIHKHLARHTSLSASRKPGSVLFRTARQYLVSIGRPINAWIQFHQANRAFTQNLVELSGWRPDVVHAHDLNVLDAAARLARMTGARLVYDSHEIWSELGGYSSWYRRWLRGYEGRILRESKPKLIVVSQGMGEWFESAHRVSPSAIVMNVPSPGVVAPPIWRPEVANKPVFLYQGALLPGRGIEACIEGFALVGDRARLIVRGPGAFADHLRALVARLGSQNVTIEPPVPGNEVVAAAARDGDVGLVPYVGYSLNNKIALPNKFFEYAHAGLGVVTAPLPEIFRVPEAQRFATALDEVSAAALAKTVSRLLDTGAIVEMKANAREACRTGGPFTWESAVHPLLELYESLA